MSSIAQIMQTFFAESRALLEQMEADLLGLEAEPGNADTLNAVFRGAHTIKGSAGLFGFDHVVGFTHVLETVLDHARDGQLLLGADIVGLLLECRDHIGQLLESAANEIEPDAATLAQGDALASRLHTFSGDPEHAALAVAVTDVAVQAQEGDAPAHGEDTWHISVRFDRDLFRKGLSPVPVLRCLSGLGELDYTATVTDSMPDASRMDPESCYIGLEIRLRSSASKAEIEDAFEFVREDCQLRILPPGSRVEDFMRLIEDLPEDRLRLGELLVDCGAVTPRELQSVLAAQEQERGRDGTTPPIGELAVQAQVAPAAVVKAALKKQQEARLRQSSEAQLIRVQSSKLDGLIDRVGELVIASAGVSQMASRIGENGLLESVSSMARLVEDIREDAMRLRMVEIGETFNRFRRVVRDTCHQLGKDIELRIEGGETELDKSLVEQIADPLTHLVRNAMDHGIEAADRRESAGKPPRGTILLSARHEGGHVLIEIADDGCGLDRDAILAKARERGMLEEDIEPGDHEIWNLIFAPGFSTAAQVSDLSGRGVGMDVVKRRIEALRGSIDIDSALGRGTTFRIRLPLTLAIIDGFLMGVACSHYVAPLDAVVECVELPEDDTHQGYLNLRGEVLPLLDLRRHFALGGQPPRRRSVVVIDHFGSKAGLMVDALEGELQSVIKPLGRLFQRLVGISGTTILGSGEVALVLDIPSLMTGVAAQPQHRPTHHH